MPNTVERLRRGYRVCLTSHAPLVLDVVWALGVIGRHGGTDADVRRMLNLSPQEAEVAKHALQIRPRVYYFQRDGRAVDISDLDPGAERLGESGWGGLTEFSGRIGEVVAEVINRYERKKSVINRVSCRYRRSHARHLHPYPVLSSQVRLLRLQ